MSEKKSFGSILRRLREEKQKKWIERKQWTQTAVARRIGVSRQAYISWEHDMSLPDIDNLKRIIAILRPDSDDVKQLLERYPLEVHYAGTLISTSGLSITDYMRFISDKADLMQEVGLGSLPPLDQAELLILFHDKLATYIGTRLVEPMTEQQLAEFGHLFSTKDDAGALRWLNANRPDHQEIVADEYAKLKATLAQMAPQLLALYEKSTDKPPE